MEEILVMDFIRLVILKVFGKKAELNYRIRDKSYIEKENEIKEIFKYIYKSCDYQ